MTDIPLHILERRKAEALAAIERWSADMEARRTVIAINTELARRRKPAEVQRPVIWNSDLRRDESGNAAFT